jgi:hypothetical protein
MMVGLGTEASLGDRFVGLIFGVGKGRAFRVF